MDLEINPAFEERLIAHKVVTTPRGRLVGSDGIGGSPRRPRSLSAPRTRQRASDLVNNLYERMGVNYQRGQGTDFTASPERMAATPQPFLSRPTTPANVVATPSNSHTIFQRPGEDDNIANNNVGNFGELTQSRSFHDRYRVATSRGRASDRSMTGSAPGEDVQSETRPRSLSRGRVAQRWPPARTEELVAAPATPLQTQAKPAHSSPSRSSSRPAWMELPAAAAYSKESSNNSQARSVEAEEKKEDHAHEASVGSHVPLKDRISVFGTKKGAASKTSRSRPALRSVDPKYAAQFAVRDHPPKIDIYADTKDPSTSETTDMSTEISPTPTTEHGKSQYQDQQQQQSQTQATIQSSPSVKKMGSIAMAYMSAIQSPSKSPKTSKSSIPPREIAVSATPDLGLAPNDSQSLAGVSTVSGDEFSNTRERALANSAAPTRRQNWRSSQTPKNQVQSYSNNVAAFPTSPPLTTPSEDMLERLVEERVNERMVNIESKIEDSLRRLVGAMEERVMARLACIEQKMVHEI